NIAPGNAEMSESCGNLDGWLRKKSHHIGLWKWRYFQFEGKSGILRYWKKQRLAEENQKPRGEISLSGCHVAACCGPCRFVLRAPEARYDEELETETSEQRDLWICSLNAAALRHRLASSDDQVTPEHWLQAKGMWQTLKNAVSDSMSAATPGGHSEEADRVSVEAAALRYTRCGAALLRLSGARHPPRQGRLVVAGRKVRDSLLRSRCEVETGGCLPCDAGVGTEFWLLLLSSRVISAPSGESQVLNSASLLKPPRDSYLKFEVLYAFNDPLDSSEPVASLPLLHCEVGEVTQCKYGNGWSLCIYEVAEETGLPGGASWLLTLETRDDCELWAEAAKAARWAARAQARGKRRAAEEALASFNSNPAEWCQAASRRLKQVAEYAPRGHSKSSANEPQTDGPPPTLSAASRLRAWASPRTTRLQLGLTGDGSIVSAASSAQASVASWTPTAAAIDAATEAVRRVLAACDDVCGEAEGLLEAALAKRPLQQEAAGAALRCALIPALATAGANGIQIFPNQRHESSSGGLRPGGKRPRTWAWPSRRPLSPGAGGGLAGSVGPRTTVERR
ncbi:Hypothetical protein (Fragment), partial [Durusdinium trenchii]